MGLERKINAREIVMNVGMSAHPEHYSGRGATLSDLNGEILEKTYKVIQKEYGKKVSEEFVQMVADTPKLSATDFLLNLYKLEGNGWKWDKKNLGSENGVYVDGPTDEAKMVVGFVTIAEVMFGDRSIDYTRQIRDFFLKRHGIKQLEKDRYYFFKLLKTPDF